MLRGIYRIFKIFTGVGLLTCAILKWCGLLPYATMGEICMLWSVVYGLGAGTIDFNLIVDKFVGGTKHEQENL